MKTFSKSDLVERNICESFNNWILRFRSLRPIAMLEGIRVSVITRLVKNQRKIDQWKDIFPPVVRGKLEKAKHEARMCTSRPSSETMHEVSVDGKGFMVDLNNQKFTSSWWALNDIPCCHASITSMRRQSDLYVDGFFKMEFVKSASRQHRYKYNKLNLDL
ncbi:unnamed protein product [Linum trigynum]|uniref:Transposase n=1 Tax=Linum trigynum TaxID=586398 RepID=A0AAV2GD54_9ROSI